MELENELQSLQIDRANAVGDYEVCQYSGAVNVTNIHAGGVPEATEQYTGYRRQVQNCAFWLHCA